EVRLLVLLIVLLVYRVCRENAFCCILHFLLVGLIVGDLVGILVFVVVFLILPLVRREVSVQVFVDSLDWVGVEDSCLV
ncbi:hypothetical protein AAHH78_36365, partial [Burkholderia pseudomallei]